MVSSQAKTVKEYLNELPAGRRESIETIRNLILEHLPEGYVETMRWGMISYEVPLEVFQDTYNKQPLNYAGLAAQKNYNSLYLMSIYMDPKQLGWFCKPMPRREESLIWVNRACTLKKLGIFRWR